MICPVSIAIFGCLLYTSDLLYFAIRNVLCWSMNCNVQKCNLICWSMNCSVQFHCLCLVVCSQHIPIFGCLQYASDLLCFAVRNFPSSPTGPFCHLWKSRSMAMFWHRQLPSQVSLTTTTCRRQVRPTLEYEFFSSISRTPMFGCLQ